MNEYVNEEDRVGETPKAIPGVSSDLFTGVLVAATILVLGVVSIIAFLS